MSFASASITLSSPELQLAIESVMVCRLDLERHKDKFTVSDTMQRVYSERQAALVALYDKLNAERTALATR